MVLREQLQDYELAYFAGFFDGEGCIRIQHRNKDGCSCSSHVFISNTYKPILEKFATIFGGSVKLKRNKTTTHRTCWVWRICSRNEIINFLTMICPFLNEKRAQAELMLEFCNIPTDCRITNRYLTDEQKITKADMAKKIAMIDKELRELKRKDSNE